MYIGDSMIKSALTQTPVAKSYATTWLSNYFEFYTEYDPEKPVREVSIQSKAALYSEYCNDMKSTNMECISSTDFHDIWSSIFPDVRKRDFCGIFGKCDQCYNIKEAGKKAKTVAEKEAARDAWVAHRGGNFMEERARSCVYASAAIRIYILLDDV